ncbi:nuclease [Rhodococcus sp. NCIMB 12038]|nr:nuclease [Rhodococcus sp. NCIMB 12038]
MERVIEDHLVSACTQHHLLCLKMTSPGRRAVPDRLVIGHDDRSDPVLLFIELKRPGGIPRPDQRAMFAQMRAHGAHVVVADSTAAIDQLLDDYFLRTPRPISLRDPRDAPLPGKQAAVLVLGN